jgi:hypothetical protein
VDRAGKQHGGLARAQKNMISEFVQQAERRAAIMAGLRACAEAPNREQARDEALQLTAELLLIVSGLETQQAFLEAMK